LPPDLRRLDFLPGWSDAGLPDLRFEVSSGLADFRFPAKRPPDFSASSLSFCAA
jgi:hypothetical protein